MTPFQVVVRYSSFAALATVVNLATQHASLFLYDGTASLYLAIAMGTGTGLVTKFVLDKHWIFFDRVGGTRAQSQQFALYLCMGLFTTALFWGSEIAFAMYFDAVIMRDLGAVLGLAAGYYIKYQLDKRFVFNQVRTAE